MNENLYRAHKNLPHKTLRVHSARYTQCIHVSSRKLKLPKDTHTKKYKQLLPPTPSLSLTCVYTFVYSLSLSLSLLIFFIIYIYFSFISIYIYVYFYVFFLCELSFIYIFVYVTGNPCQAFHEMAKSYRQYT